MQPLTSDAHEAVGEDGQVNGVKLRTHHAGRLGPHGDADVPSLSHLCLAAWLHQDGTGGKGAEGLEEPGQTPPNQVPHMPRPRNIPTMKGPQSPPDSCSWSQRTAPHHHCQGPTVHHGPHPTHPHPGQASAHLLLSMMRQGP